MKVLKQDFFALMIFLLFGGLIYFPILNNAFLSDDYDSLYRICIERTIIIKEFFRPIIDVSFKFNYLIGGLNPKGFYIFNLAVHILNAYLVYKIAFALKPVSKDHLVLVSWLSAFLFLIYPFHNEGVVWLTGRLASISCFFGLLTVWLWLSEMKIWVKIIIGLIFYFIGLLAYESILFLPIIILILTWSRNFTVKHTAYLFALCVGIIAAYLLVRFHASGNVYGEYGARMTDYGIYNIVIKGCKTMGRLFLPPSEVSGMLTVAFLIVIIGLVFLNIKIYRKYGISQLLQFFKLILSLIIAMIIPCLFGISTRTSESDRLLYFPSVFLCLILSSMVVLLIKTKRAQVTGFLGMSLYFLIFLVLNNLNWERASFAADKIMKIAGGANERNVIYVNLPDEIEGAFVFRNGFKKAIVLHGIDTASVYVNNYLTRLEYLEFGDQIKTAQIGEVLMLPPVTKLTFLANDSIKIENTIDLTKRIFWKHNSTLLYWNKEDLIRLF